MAINFLKKIIQAKPTYLHFFTGCWIRAHLATSKKWKFKIFKKKTEIGCFSTFSLLNIRLINFNYFHFINLWFMKIEFSEKLSFQENSRSSIRKNLFLFQLLLISVVKDNTEAILHKFWTFQNTFKLKVILTNFPYNLCTKNL